MNQPRLYERPVPLTRERHSGWFVEPPKTYGFARHFSSVPITIGEFSRAALDHPIVFAPAGEGLLGPVAVMGIGSNVSIASDGSWVGRKYMPAFIRRYPFVLSSPRDGRADVFLDEAYSGLNQENRGEPLIEADGSRSPYLDKVISFLGAFQAQLAQTREFSKRLAQLSLLQPVTVTAEKASGGSKSTFNGFSAIDGRRLRELGGETLAELNRSFGLEPIYAHVLSLQRMSELVPARADA